MPKRDGSTMPITHADIGDQIAKIMHAVRADGDEPVRADGDALERHERAATRRWRSP